MMTPQERQLVTDLFDRLATLERAERDPEAERLIAEGLERAPNAPYALVQTVLVQDQALRDADARIRDLEGSGGDRVRKTRFLDDMRGALFGHKEEPRASVPAVKAPAETSAYGRGGNAQASPPDQGQGGSFLGTAAAAAAGVIGGALLLDSIRSMMGARQGAMGDASAAGGGDRPWGGGAPDSDLARQAGIEDVGGGRQARDNSGGESSGLFDTAEADLDDDAPDGDFDLGGGSDLA
jgi:uncharacterized protein